MIDRRANDLQYHFGLRYAGGARCLLNLKLGRAGFETSIPVGVYELDVDAELWVKLRLAPVSPYVGTLSLAFVRLPTIKLVLAPFRVVNLFSIPFLNNFLSKLLTVDLPRLLVLPRHITFDFLPQGQNVMDSMKAMEESMDESIASGVLDLLKTTSTEPAVPQDDPSEVFVGELSVTICDARGLPIRGFTGWSNPYCILSLGDQVLESKRNKETSHPSGPKDPVWNQDFLLLVEDPRRQRLMLRVRDSAMTLNPNIGYCEINLAELRVSTRIIVIFIVSGVSIQLFVDDGFQNGTRTEQSCFEALLMARSRVFKNKTLKPLFWYHSGTHELNLSERL